MVQIKANWTDVKGTIVGIAGSSDRPLFKEVSILVDAARPVKGFSNFLRGAVGKTIVINVSADTVRAVPMSEGGKIRCRIRKGRGPVGLFAKSDTVIIGSSHSKRRGESGTS